MSLPSKANIVEEAGYKSLINLIDLEVPATPAFLLDKARIISTAKKIQQLKEHCEFDFLYSIKSLPLASVLEWLKPYIDGFSVSSLFEARLANEILAGVGCVHLTTPGLTVPEISELSQLCQFISCNSLDQFNRLMPVAATGCSLGLRINPGLSNVSDPRYDPCRVNSKLGVPIEQLIETPLSGQIAGLHFHNNFAGCNFEHLNKTLAFLITKLHRQMYEIKWINLGGGYLFDEIEGFQKFITLVNQLNQEFGLKVMIEPGKAVVGQAGYLCATVIDIFTSGSKKIAVLNTSVNHNPEVFEYQVQPELMHTDSRGSHHYELVGNTCLAGDLFGQYRFTKPLSLGDPLIFKNVGAYTLVKASRFNGYNLPDIYGIRDNQLSLIKSYDYQDYRRQWL